MFVRMYVVLPAPKRKGQCVVGYTCIWKGIPFIFKKRLLCHMIATTRIKSCSCQLNILLVEAKRNFSFVTNRIQLAVTKQHY